MRNKIHSWPFVYGQTRPRFLNKYVGEARSASVVSLHQYMKHTWHRGVETSPRTLHLNKCYFDVLTSQEKNEIHTWMDGWMDGSFTQASSTFYFAATWNFNKSLVGLTIIGSRGWYDAVAADQSQFLRCLAGVTYFFEKVDYSVIRHTCRFTTRTSGTAPQ